MQPPDEGYNPKRIGGITASPIEHPRCPKCGSTLLFNGSLVWCTFIGSSTEKACDFGIGIHRNITRNEATVLWLKSVDIGQRLTDSQIAMFRGNIPAEEVNPKVVGLIVGQKLTDDQVAMLFGNPPIEEMGPKVDGSITVEIVEATEHRVEEFKANGKYAKVAWDDEGASTVLVSNIAKTKSSVPSTGMQYQEELRVQRALLNIDAAIIAKQTWAQLTD